MAATRFYSLMFFAILSVLGYLSYQIFQPFLTPITWAMVLCVVFYPAYAFALQVVKVKAVASIITLVIILTAIIGPFSYISYSLINEVGDIAAGSDAEVKKLSELLSGERVSSVLRKIEPYTGMEGPSDRVIVENAKKASQRIVEGLSAGFGNVMSVAANFLIMAFTIFFFLKDGPGFLRRSRDYLPFSEPQKDKLTLQVKDMIVSTIYGGVVVAIVQGIIGGIAFTVLGLRSPIFWGSAMALASFVPLLGTAIIWLPGSVILVLEGAYMKGIALSLIGLFIISMVDNILKPLIIGGRTKMPTVIIFFTVLGGIRLFGLVGLVMGPLVFALFLSVFEIFRSMEGESGETDSSS